MCIYSIHIRGDRIGDAEFHKVTHDHQTQTIYNIVTIELVTFMKLRKKIFSAFYGACYKLREKRYKQCVGKKIALGCYSSPIYVNNIPYGLEGVERYAYGKQQFKVRHRHSYVEKLKGVMYSARKETGIFEDKQNNEVYCQTYSDYSFTP